MIPSVLSLLKDQSRDVTPRLESSIIFQCKFISHPGIFFISGYYYYDYVIKGSSGSSSSSISRRTDRWVHLQQNGGLRLFVHT